MVKNANNFTNSSPKIKRMEHFSFHPMKLNIGYEANITLVILTKLSKENYRLIFLMNIHAEILQTKSSNI